MGVTLTVKSFVPAGAEYFETQLWAIADKLRGNKESSDY
ncbi:type I restriction-modification system subunit M N-terminal domain-containing protein [Nitrosococcus oceani]|nr:type I restriction-modification system subunit M N-terminal domain-containing protein [Nitrosococcus oceani]